MAYTSFENEEKKEIVDASEREGRGENKFSQQLWLFVFSSLFSLAFFFLPSLF